MKPAATWRTRLRSTSIQTTDSTKKTFITSGYHLQEDLPRHLLPQLHLQLRRRLQLAQPQRLRLLQQPRPRLQLQLQLQPQPLRRPHQHQQLLLLPDRRRRRDLGQRRGHVLLLLQGQFKGKDIAPAMCRRGDRNTASLRQTAPGIVATAL